jgi:hypothetical protein
MNVIWEFRSKKKEIIWKEKNRYKVNDKGDREREGYKKRIRK